MVSKVIVTIVDEGFYKKTLRFSPDTKLKKVLDLYRTHICDKCSDAEALEFWFETTKITDGHTADILGIQTGDIIDVYLAKSCTRGACPVPTLQTLPNLHYLDAAGVSRTVHVEECLYQPRPPKRTTMKIQDINDFSMVFRTRVDSKLIHAMQTFAATTRKDLQDCRFSLDGNRITDEDTPESLEMEEDDLIQVFFEVTGGGLEH